MMAGMVKRGMVNDMLKFLVNGWEVWVAGRGQVTGRVGDDYCRVG